MMGIVFDYPVIIACIGATLIGITSGILSCYAVLKQQSLLGDAISHAALPGLCMAFLLTLSKHPLILFFGALISGLIGTFFILSLIRYSIIKEDTALGIILSVFFGFGLLLLTVIQKIPSARQAGLSTYLFGNAASILLSDIIIMAVCSVIIMITVSLFWKEFKIIVFDQHYSKSLGLPIFKLDILLLSLIVITIVIGLQTVGVILMSALIIAPATAARQWSNRLDTMMLLSISFCIISGISGVLLSSSIPRLPTGPIIVIMISIIVIISILFSPRGIIYRFILEKIHQQQIKGHKILVNLFHLAKTHPDLTHPHDINTLTVLGGKPPLSQLTKLKEKGLLSNIEHDIWGLTPKGIKAVSTLLNDPNIKIESSSS